MSENLPHPVIELLETRRQQIEDDHVLGLVVEGGGLRGVLTAGMLISMEQNGYGPDIFDFVVGSSAGAFNAAYFLSGNVSEGATIYSEHSAQHGFIDLKAWLKLRERRPIMDVSIHTNHLLEGVVPLDWENIIASEKLHIAVSDPHEIGTRVLPPPSDKDELKRNLRATAHIPILAGRPTLIDGLPYYDGSLTAPLPIEEAISLGATHVLALSSRSLKKWRNKQTRIERLASRLYNLRYPGIDAAVSQGVETAIQRVQYLIEARDNPEDIPFIYTVDAPENIQIRQFEADAAKLADGVRLGKIALASCLPPASQR
ncbi:MAG TPA: patatin-like phospholipase family protein [Candidatus Nitrosopolaris sp.]|nr:patatin-like phospholipase family protein [Candidatus Nitrosopolaris sp.]